VREVTVSITEQLNAKSTGEQHAAFLRLRQIDEDAACEALG
jgi:hypothetical protein